MTNKEFRITTLEQALHKYTSEGDAPRACTVGEPDEEESDVAIRLEELEEKVRCMTGGTKNTSSTAYRKPISEFKVIQNINLRCQWQEAFHQPT